METTNDNLIDKQLYISMQQGNKKAFGAYQPVSKEPQSSQN